MAQIPKFDRGGKQPTPKNLQEYTSQQEKNKEEFNKKESEAKTVKINGKLYSIPEAKGRLSEWVTSDEAKRTRASYGRRGSTVDDAYSNFMESLDKGYIKEIVSTPSGFNIQFVEGTPGYSNPNKYSSDYISKAIENNLLDLAEYNNELQTPEKIDLRWDPRRFISDVWGGKIDQDLYNKKTVSERADDVIKALEQVRGNYYDFLNAEDKSAFKNYENLPFHNIQELDNLIEALSNTGNLDVEGESAPWSDFSRNEQIQYQNFGDFIRKYIHGESTSDKEVVTPVASGEETQGDKGDGLTPDQLNILKSFGLTSGDPTTFTYNNSPLGITTEGQLVTQDPVGNVKPMTGYYNFQADPNTYQLNSGWYDKGSYIPFEKLQEYLAANPDYLNTVYNPTVNDWRNSLTQFEEGEYDPKIGSYNIYNQLSKLLDIPEGQKFRVQNLADYLLEPSVRDRYEVLGIYTDPDIDAQLSQGRPADASKLVAIDKETNMIVPVTGGYDKGLYYLYPGGDTSKETGEINRILARGISPTPVVNRSYKELRDSLQRILNKYTDTQDINANYNPSVVTIHQQGGVIATTPVNVFNQKEATLSDVFDKDIKLSKADRADLAALALDVTGLVSTLAAGVGNVVGTASGLGSTISTAIADYSRDNDWSWGDTGNLLLNLGMDAVTLIPGLGTVAKGGKVVKAIKKAAPLLMNAFTAAGLVQAGQAVSKIISGEDPTVNDWRLLASGLTAISGKGRQLAERRAFTQKAGQSKPLEIKIGDEVREVRINNSDIKTFNSKSKKEKVKFIQDQLRGSIPEEDLNNIQLPDSKWYNPLTRSKNKAKEGSRGREFKPEVIERVKRGEYGRFKRGALAEQAAFGRGRFMEQLDDSGIQLIYNRVGNPTLIQYKEGGVLNIIPNVGKEIEKFDNGGNLVKTNLGYVIKSGDKDYYGNQYTDFSKGILGDEATVIANPTTQRRQSGPLLGTVSSGGLQIGGVNTAGANRDRLIITKSVEDQPLSNTLNLDTGKLQKRELKNPLTGGTGSESENRLNMNNKKFSIPMSTINSTASMINKLLTNAKIYRDLKKSLRPNLLTTPTEVSYTIQGNEGVRQAYNNQATKLESMTRNALTSDINKQMAFNMEVAKNAANLRLQGDLANEQALQQSRDKALQVQLNNLQRREQVSNANQQSIINHNNMLANLKAQKTAQNSNILDTYLHDVNAQLKQYGNSMDRYNTQNQIIDTQQSNLSADLKDRQNISQIEQQIAALDKNDPDYLNKREVLNTSRLNLLKTIQGRQFDLNRLGLQGQLPKYFESGGKLNKK